jgi:phospholipid-binding lipoprotein MlaA
VNRGIFWVNDGLDRHALEPVARGWDWALPDFVQHAVRNAFDNLRFPVVFMNDLLQGKPAGAARTFARFAVNTTVGVGGFMDPASKIGLRPRNEDFGQTLGYWGVPGGPFLMLPLLGPSNVRDTAGMVVDTGFRVIGFFLPLVASVGMTTVETLNERSLILDEIAAERKAALDWYAAVRSAYTQYRENLVRDRRSAVREDDAYRDYYPVFESRDAPSQQP